MKKFILGLAALISVSSFAETLPSVENEATLYCGSPFTDTKRAFKVMVDGSRDQNFGITRITWYDLAAGETPSGTAIINEKLELQLMGAPAGKIVKSYFGADIFAADYILAFADTKSGGSQILVPAEEIVKNLSTGNIVVHVFELKRDPSADAFKLIRWLCATPMQR
jgi:hypothetical protein